MSTPQFREGEVFTRAAVEVRAASTEEGRKRREFRAIGVPYGQRIDLGGFREEFAPGSVENGDRALILWAHRDHEVLGRVAEYRETDDGFEIVARLSDTERGREAYTLLEDEVVDRMSIGFQMREWRVETDEDGTETVIHTRVKALEFSLVPFPAYEGAAVTEVRRLHTQNTDPRKQETVMAPEPLTRSDLDSALEPFEDKFNVIERKLSQAVTSGGSSDEVSSLAQRFSSMGDYMKRAAAGDADALKLHETLYRAPAAGATTANVPNYAKENFLGTQIRFVDERREVTNMFTRAALPATGMTVEYAQLDVAASTFLVGEQPAELDALPGPSLVSFTQASAPVRTYGGWTRLSRQVIERAHLPYLDTVLKGMTLEYARQTEAAVRTALVAQLDALAASATVGATLTRSEADAAALTISDWAEIIVDAGDVFSTRGFRYAGLAVSPNVFKGLAATTASDGRPLMNISGQPGTNVAGTMNLVTGDGELLRVPVKIVRGVGDGRVFFWDPAAIEVRESAGAPVLLQDENIIILGRDFSIYGYQAVTIPFQHALLPVEFGVV